MRWIELPVGIVVTLLSSVALAAPPLSDDFNVCDLGAAWSFVDPIGDSSFQVVGAGSGNASLQISVPAGVEHSPYGVNESARVVQAVDDSDFEIEALFESTMDSKYQEQGLLVEGLDPSNFLRFDAYHNGSGVKLYSATFVGGSASRRLNISIPGNGSVFLRLGRVGDAWTASYSLDGTNWIVATTFTHAMSVTSVGVFAGNEGSSKPAHTAIIDYFASTADPIVDEDLGAAGENELFITSIGDGTVDVSPDLPLYGCDEQVTLTPQPASGWYFSGWGGEVSGSDDPLVVTLSSDLSVDANFEAITTPPQISGIAVSPGETTATISWTTDQLATSLVDYGETAGYELGTAAGPLATQHSIQLSNLEWGRLYHYRIDVQNELGYTTSTADLTFTTLVPPGVDLSGIVSDDFNSCAIAPEWSFVDPVGDSSFVLLGAGSGDASLQITVPTGTAHDPFGTNDAARMMQTASNVDFEIEARFQSTLDSRYQEQGLMVEGSGVGNWIRFDIYHDGTNTKLYAASFAGGSSNTRLNQVVGGDGAFHLRLGRSGDLWTASYSVDGLLWTEAVNFSHAMAVDSVGVFAGNAGSANPGHTAIVDYFANNASPIADEDAASVGASQLFVSTFGDGAVDVSPDLPTYGCGQPVTLTAQPASGWLFTGWSGDLAGSENPTVVFLSADLSIEANFDPIATPPQISNVTSVRTETTATISWETDHLATTNFFYGESTGYELGAIAGPLSTSHSVQLSGLQPGQLYHFLIEAQNQAGYTASTGDLTFTTQAPSGVDLSGIVSDDFNACQLGPQWSFVDPLGDSTFALARDGGDALIQLAIPAGTPHNSYKVNDAARLMQPANDVDFQIEARFQSTMDSQYQDQGLMVASADPSNWIRFDTFHDGTDQYLYAGTFVAGTAKKRLKQLIAPGPITLRLDRSGDVWTASYSLDGVAWQEAVQFSHVIGVDSVGVYAGTAGDNSPAHTARIDYFANNASPIANEDGVVIPADRALTVSVVGSGAVDVSPDLPLYTCGQLVTLTPQLPSGWTFEGWGIDASGMDIPLELTMSSDLEVGVTFELITTPPAISNLAVTRTETTATLTWDTDHLATSTFEYGETTSYELGAIAGPLATSHSVQLTDLSPGTPHYVRLTLVNELGYTTVDSGITFTTRAPPGVDLSGIESDDFNVFALDLRWNFVDPVGDSSFALVGPGTGEASLQVTAGQGTSHDAYGVNNAARMMQAAVDVSFEIEAHFQSTLVASQDQGLLVEGADPGDWVRLDVYHDGTDVFLYAATFQNGAANRRVQMSIPTPGSVYLRLGRVDDDWTASYSLDGVNWQVAATFFYEMQVDQVGVYAGNFGNSPPAHTAIIDYFENTASPIVDEDGADVVDDIPPRILNLRVSVTDTSFVVLFDTDEASTGYVDYGFDTSYSLGTEVGTSGILRHSIQVGNLASETDYEVRVRAADALGNEAESTFAVTTLPFGAQLGPVFDVWYGSNQTFGNPGVPQDWAGVLGNVSDPDGIASLTYSLNGGPQVAMGVGPNTRRLDEEGDFNVDLLYSELADGPNQLTLEAIDNFGYATTEVVTVDYNSGNVVPDSYTVDWAAASQISDVAQVVDGLWTLDGAHLRPVQLGFDRLVALGDLLWDDYEVEAKITINSYEPFFESPSNGPGVGIGVRWHGHEYGNGDTQPGQKWWPMGSIVMWRIRSNGHQEFNQWGSQAGVPDKIPGTMTFGVEYTFKMRAETLPDGSHLYSYKVWPSGDAEPPTWDNQIAEPAGEPGAGSVLLIAHHVDASFGIVTVTPLP